MSECPICGADAPEGELCEECAERQADQEPAPEKKGWELQSVEVSPTPGPAVGQFKGWSLAVELTLPAEAGGAELWDAVNAELERLWSATVDEVVASEEWRSHGAALKRLAGAEAQAQEARAALAEAERDLERFNTGEVDGDFVIL